MCSCYDLNIHFKKCQRKFSLSSQISAVIVMSNQIGILTVRQGQTEVGNTTIKCNSVNGKLL